MPKISLIIVTGLPGTGKTTLGKKLAEEFKLPFICKDDFKELIFDNLGYKDRDWSKKIGGLSYDLLYFTTETLLKAGQSLIVETNFNPKFANQKFLDLKEKYNFEPIQMRCLADGEILYDRFAKRANSKDRHPGHADDGSLEEWKPVLLQGAIEPLAIGGELIDINTTEFSTINYEDLFNKIKLLINKA